MHVRQETGWQTNDRLAGGTQQEEPCAVTGLKVGVGEITELSTNLTYKAAALHEKCCWCIPKLLQKCHHVWTQMLLNPDEKETGVK